MFLFVWQFTSIILGCLILACRLWRGCWMPWRFWPLLCRKERWLFTAMLDWAGQASCNLCIITLRWYSIWVLNINPIVQVFLSHAIWSTPVESVLVKLSTMFGSEGLAPSRLDHRSIWCLISPGWWALSWPNTHVWTCGTVTPSVSGITSCVRAFCCTGMRPEPSNTRPRSCTSSAACWSLSPRGLPVLQRSRENWRRGWTSWPWRRQWRWHFWRETCLLWRKGEAHAERTPASPGTSHLGSWRGRETSF